jgi:hypothetical protein
MLDIKKLEHVQVKQIQDLIVEFRKHQVSRFPIEVIPNDAGFAVGFIDSRFPTDRWSATNMLAMLYVKEQGENPTLTIESRLIENDKYAQYNDDYHTKSTKDMKKMLKFMKDFIKPWSAHEVASKTKTKAEEKFKEWQREPYRKLRTATNALDSTDFLKMFVKLKELGVAPVNADMKMLYESALPEYLDYQGREGKKFANTHAFINPDESVFISNVGIDSGRTVAKLFNSIDEMPINVQQNLAMLRMMENDVLVADVGHKISEREFWVEGYPQEPNA